MLAAVSNASRYDWSTWLIGIMRSFLSGAATALTTGTGGAIIGIPGKQLWILMGVNFVLMGLYRMGEFLQLHGSPDPVALQVALDKAATATKQAQGAVEEAKSASPPADK
jgi:hypothetical protein